MQRLRFSIRGVMALIVASGFGFSALRYATELWASTVFSLTLIGFALATAYAIHLRGPRRALWSAFRHDGSRASFTGLASVSTGPPSR